MRKLAIDLVLSYHRINSFVKSIILVILIYFSDGCDMMDAKALKTFLTVAKCLNFGEAARRLSYSQSTISEHIRIIEASLGVRVFERLGRKVFLTDHGSKLIPYAEKIVTNSEELTQLFSQNGKIKGLISIAVVETLCVYWLPPLLKEYSTKYPDVEIKIKLGECEEFAELLLQNIVDVAFNINDLSKNQYIRQINLFRGEATFIVPPDSPLTGGNSMEFNELDKETIIAPEQGCEYRAHFDAMLRKENISAKSIIELSSLDAIKKCVKNGLGIGLIPQIAVQEELDKGELVSLNIKRTIAYQGRMSFHREKWLSPALKALENLVLQREK